MRFLLAADNFTRGSGGAPRSAQELTGALLGAGHQVAVTETGNPPGRTDWNGAELHRVRLHGRLLPADHDLRTILLNPRWQKRVGTLIAEFGPDLVLTQGMLAPGAVSAAHRARLPAAYFFRGYAPFCPRQYMGLDPEEDCRRPDCRRCLTPAQRLKLPLIRGALKLYEETLPGAELLVANSRYVAGLFERLWGVNAEVVLPAGGLTPAGAPENDPAGYMLFIKPQKIKGLDLVIELARRLPERSFAVAGETRGAAERELARLPNVKLLGWCDDMRQVYCRARLLLGPSLWPEPFGRVFAEAAAVGCPSLAFRCGGIPEAAGDGAVLLDRAAGPDEWLAAIRQLDNPSVYGPLREAALAHAGRLTGGNELQRAVGLLESAARNGVRALPPSPPPGRKLRVVHLIGALPRGGAEISLMHLATRLDRAAFDVRVICTREEGELADAFRHAGVPVELLHLPSRYSPAGLLRLAQRLAQLRADIVHTHLRRANTSGRIAAWLAGTPVIIAHERNPGPDKNRRHFLVDRLLSTISSTIVAVSRQTAERNSRLSGIPLERFTILPNAVDLGEFVPGDRTAARRRLGLDTDGFVLGFAGRLHPVKNLDVLLRAFALASRKQPGIRLALAGDGPLHRDLLGQAGELGVSENVVFLGARDEMHLVYPAFDALALVSSSEGCSRVMIEAAACGLPLLLTPVGHAPVFAVEGRAALFVPADDVERLAAAISRLAGDDRLRAELSAGARAAAAPHGLGEYVSRIERLYREMWNAGSLRQHAR